MRVKVQGGTARLGDPPLCQSCRHAAVVTGTSDRHRIVECSQLASRVRFHVTSCTEYVNRQHPSICEMEDMAWVLRTDAKRRTIGFVHGRTLRYDERLVVDED